jgi:hypothetical protein
VQFDLGRPRELFHCLTGTLQVLIRYSEIYTQVPLSRLKTFHCLCAADTLIGRDSCDQAFDPFDAEQVVFGSNPGCVSVSRPNLSAESKETFGGAFKEGFREFDSDSHIHQPAECPIGSPPNPIAV